MCLVFLVAAGIVTAIVMKILKVNDDVAKLPGPDKNNGDEVCIFSLNMVHLLHQLLVD